MKVCRRETFNAAHRLFNPTFDDAKNQAIFGKCNNPNYHGHNYALLVCVDGPIDPETGKPKLDKNQTDETAKKRPVLGLINIWGFIPKANNIWDEGNIYDPKNGNTYSSTMKLINANTLEVRGYIGVSLIGRTDTWTRQVK